MSPDVSNVISPASFKLISLPAQLRGSLYFGVLPSSVHEVEKSFLVIFGHKAFGHIHISIVLGSLQAAPGMIR